MMDEPKSLTDAVQKMKRDRLLLRSGTSIANMAAIPSFILTFGIGACAFVVGLSLGYVALRGTSEDAGLGLGVVLGMGAAFGALMGSFWVTNRARKALVDHVEENAETSTRHAADLQSKLEANPNLAEAAAGLTMTSDASGGELSPSRLENLKAQEKATEPNLTATPESEP